MLGVVGGDMLLIVDIVDVGGEGKGGVLGVGVIMCVGVFCMVLKCGVMNWCLG